MFKAPRSPSNPLPGNRWAKWQQLFRSLGRLLNTPGDSLMIRLHLH